MIIGITGTNGAGKGTVVEYLVQKGFAHYSVRAFLITEIERRRLPVDRSSMRDVANDLRRQHGPEYFDKIFLAEAKEKGQQNIIIESVRTIGSARYLKEQGAVLLSVDANRHIRYDRVTKRASHTDKVDFDTWVKEEEREWHNEAAHDMNVPGVMQMADYTLHNDGTVEELYAQIDAVLSKLRT